MLKGGSSYKWIVLGLLFGAYFLLQGMRQFYFASIPAIRADFDVGAAKLGMVATAFLLVYAICAPCASVVADLLRRKTIIVLGCLVFSAGIFAAGFSSSLWALIVFYGVVVAIGQSMVPSSSSAVISEYHEETRATALSIYQSALYLGVVLSSVFAGRVGSLGPGSWRRGFWILGAAGLVWAGIIALLLRDKPSRPAAVAAEAVSESRPTLKEALLSVLGSPAAILLTVAFGLCQYGDNGFRVWMTTYLGDSFLPEARTAAAFHSVFWFYVGAFLSINVAGRCSDRLARHRPAARFEVAAAGLALSAPCVLVAARSGSLAWACAGLFLWGFARGIYDSSFFASVYDIVSPRCRAAATGIFCCGGFIIGSSAPYVLGRIAEHSSMVVGMTSLGAFYLLGAVVIVVAARLRRPSERRN